jgi:putative sterol carrier protein
MNADNYIKMVNGEISGTMAFMKGLMKISGNMMLAQKLQGIFPPHK